MRLGSTIVQQGGARQEQHAALWSTYLRLDGVTRGHEVPGGAQPIREALQALDRIRDAPPAVVGTALWNLLPAYGNAPPEEFTRLLLHVLDLDYEAARQLQAQPAHAVFPPLPEKTTLILDSDFKVMDQGSGAWARLEVCVEREFDTLESIVDPEVWPDECPLFWDRMTLLKDGVYGGAVCLPGDEAGPTEVVMRGQITRGELGATALGVAAKLTCDRNDRLAACRLVIDMSPELGRPGWTRIVHERTVTFAPGVLQRYRKQTLAYWMKSEIACLAL